MAKNKKQGLICPEAPKVKKSGDCVAKQPLDTFLDKAGAPQSKGEEEDGGDGSPDTAAVDGGQAESPARVEETRWQAEKRLRIEGRDIEAGVFRNRVRDECRAKGMTRREAHDHAWAAAIASFPPPGEPAVDVPLPEAPAPEPASNGSNGPLSGLGEIPAAWAELPANASLQAELGWVQSNRLAIVEEKPSGSTVVHLDRAAEPAPSRAALGWLETSIRSYAKYVEVVARTLSTSVDADEQVRRERVAMGDIDALLDEMGT